MRAFWRGRMDAISVSISIAVAVSIGVVIVVVIIGSIVSVISAILNRVEGEVVDDDSGNVCPDLFQDVPCPQQRLPAGSFGTGNEDDHVGSPGADHCVGDGKHGRRVNHDVAKFFAPGVQELWHGIGSQHFGGIWRHVSGGNDVQAGDLVNLDDHGFGLLGACQTRAQTLGARDAQVFVNCGTTHVRVHKQGFLPGLGQYHREVESHETLPFLHHGTGYHDDLRRRARGGEQQRSPQSTESFRAAGIAMLHGDGLNELPGRGAAQQFVRIFAVHEYAWYNAQRGKRAVRLNVFRRADGVVHIFYDEGQRHAEQETAHAAKRDVQRDFWFHRFDGYACRVDNINIA